MTTRRYDPVLEIKDAPPVPAPVDVTIQPPSELPKVPASGSWRMILPVIMVIAVIGMVVVMARSGSGFSPLSLMFPLMMVGSMAMYMGGGSTGQQKGTAELNEERKEYLIHLAEQREAVTDAERRRHAYNTFWFTEPALLASVAGTSRQWRQASLGAAQTKGGRLLTRVARGRTASGVQSLKNPDGLESPEAAPLELLDPLGVVAVSKFVRAHRTVQDTVITLDVAKHASLVVDAVDGADRDAARALVRAIVGNLAVYNSPADLKVAAIVSESSGQWWEWLKWLPHTQSDDRYDICGTARNTFTDIDQFRAALPDLGRRGRFTRDDDGDNGLPHVVVVVDSPALIRDLPSIGKIHWIVIPDEQTRSRAAFDRIEPLHWLVVDAAGELDQIDTRGRRQNVGTADRLDLIDAEVAARRLSQWRVDGASAATTTEVGVADDRWETLVGIRDVGTFIPEKTWGAYAPRDRDRMTVVLGRDDQGRPVVLDLKEQGQHGHGPHGMVVGTSGSGKSELLRSMTLSLMATHSPDDFNLLAVDWKGGATFLGYEQSHHVLAVVTNMEEEADYVTRFEEVLRGEGARRERLFREVGEQQIGRAFSSGAEYNEYRLTHPDAGMKPLPALLVVVDEFTELLERYPDFANVFNSVGRQGRAQDIHFLLGTQRFDESKARGLEANIHYRIALKTASQQDSRAAIGVPDAGHLSEAGSGYLLPPAGLEALMKFQAPYTGSQYTPPADKEDEPTATPAQRRAMAGYVEPAAFTAVAEPLPDHDAFTAASEFDEVAEQEPAAPEEPGVRPVVIDGVEVRDASIRGVVLHRLAGKGTPPRPMWLTPINTPRPLNDALALSPNGFGNLEFPLGIVDTPRLHAQKTWTFNAATGGGHLVIVGAGQMGKTTAVQSIVLGAAVTHTSEQVQFYIMDPGGRLGALEGLPHVGSVARTPEHMRRVLATSLSLMSVRNRLFIQYDINGLDEYRDYRAAHPEIAQQDPYGEVFLVVDGYDVLVQDEQATFADEQPKFLEILSKGADVGVHLILTATSWARLNTVKPAIINRIELRLSEHFGSDIPGAQMYARELPQIAGRALATDSDHSQPKMVSLPRLDGIGDPTTIRAGLAAAIADVSAANARYRPAPPVQVLPTTIAVADILDSTIDKSTPLLHRLRIPFGLAESNLRPAIVDLARPGHMVVYGSAQSGKTTVLAAVVRGICAQLSPEEAQFIVVDPRRQLMELVPPEYLAGYLLPSHDMEAEMAQIAKSFAARMPPDDITPAQRRTRSWWQGKETFLLIDDFQMSAGLSAFDNPFTVLSPLVPLGTDIGFHVLAARSIDQASAGVQHGLLAALRAVSAPGMILDGNRLEGHLIGSEVRPAPQSHRGRGYFIEPLNQYHDIVQSGWVDLDSPAG